MRRIVSLRVVMSVCLVGVVLLVGQVAFAQPAPAAGAAAKPPSQGLISIVLDNMDPVFWTIAILSVLGMTLIIQGFIKARASVMIPETSTNHMRELIGQKQFKELIEYTETDPSFVSKALNPALKRAPSFAAMKEAMETAIGEQTADQFRKIEFLNIIGNLGPLLGLLGTVIGMIHSFQKMKESGGQADPSVLAGGISQALTHTMLGLVLALPCLAAFGVLRTMVDRLTVQGALISEELLLMVKPADAKPGTGAAAPGAARPATGAPPAAAIPAARKPMPAPPAAAV